MMVDITAGPLSSLAFCWRLERADGAGLAVTSSDRSVFHEGICYRSAPGVTPAAISRSVGLEPDTTEVAGALSFDALSENDLAGGRWNEASVSLIAVDWSEPDLDAVPLLEGTLGQIAVAGDEFSAELHGAASRLTTAPCPNTSPECRAELGDRDCRIDLAGRRLRATILSSESNGIELDQAIDDRFLFGRLRYLSGANCGLSSAVLGVTGTGLSLRDRPPAPIEAGTIIELREGCDKRLETCASRFQNAVNFRGEPHLPGTSLLTRYPGP